MSEKDSGQNNFLSACLCKLQFPHTQDHVEIIPKPIMPTIQLPEEKCVTLKREDEQRQRVQELLADVDAARAEDLQLQRKLDKEASELLKAYKAGEKCDHWLPQVLEESGADETTVRLKYELEHSRFQLAEVRNQIHSLKREMASYEKLARQELGENVNLHEILTSKKWRGRAQEIKRLKSEIASLEIKAYDHKYMENPLCIPSYKPRYPDVNDLVPPGQVRVLRDEARKKKEAREKTEREVNTLIEQYGNISLMYKASLTHNKMLAEELRSLKGQLEKYEARAREDQELVKNLIAHQMKMRELIDRESHLSRLVKKKRNEEMDLEKEGVMDAIKYKALWKSSESEKCSLEKIVEMMTRRLEGIIETAEEAERHCEDNERRRKEIEEQIAAQKDIAQPKSKAPKAKAGKVALPPGKPFSTTVQLAAVREENKYLRDFLLKAIKIKIEDLKLYQFTMNNIREQYVETLNKLKSPPETASKTKV